MAFLMVFSCFFQGDNAIKNLTRFSMKIPLKSFENPVNLPWINPQDFHGFSVYSVGNNSLTAPVEDINFTPTKRTESAPRVSPQKDDCSSLARTKGGPDYVVAYQGFLDELAKIWFNACIFKSLPKLHPEETDTAESDANISKLHIKTVKHFTESHIFALVALWC